MLVLPSSLECPSRSVKSTTVHGACFAGSTRTYLLVNTERRDHHLVEVDDWLQRLPIRRRSRLQSSGISTRCRRLPGAEGYSR